jgi:TatA/E family protein of Tat protein translocase
MPTALLFLEFLGTSELLVIAVVALLLFGPRKLPDISRTIGKSLAEFKRASDDFKRTWEYEVELERRKPALDSAEEPRPEASSPEQSAGAAGASAWGATTSSGLTSSSVTAEELMSRAVQAQDEGRTVARDSSAAGAAARSEAGAHEGAGGSGADEEGDMELNAS